MTSSVEPTSSEELFVTRSFFLGKEDFTVRSREMTVPNYSVVNRFFFINFPSLGKSDSSVFSHFLDLKTVCLILVVDQSHNGY